MKRCFAVVVLLIFVANIFAAYRRHIIVLQDNSGSYYKTDNELQIGIIQNQLIGLFKNNKIDNEYSLLNEELSKGQLFFKPETDKVSFMWFVAGQKDNYEFYTTTNGEYRDFENYFIKKGSCEYTDTNDVETFFRLNFEDRPEIESHYNSIGISTYSFSAYVYPLCMDLCLKEYADEYIVVIISDFNAGSTFGNRNDEKIFKDAFKNKSDGVIKRVNQLNSRFFKIDYFDYYLTTQYHGLIGFTGFKIRPKAGTPISENMDLRLNSDMRFEQNEFGEDVFTMAKTNIVFAHNDNLVFSRLLLSISMDDGKVIDTKDISGYVEYDSISHTYAIAQINNIHLNGKNTSASSYSGEVCYKFFMDYKIDDGKTIGYVYNVNRNVTNENFVFKTELTNTQITFMIIGILFVLGFLIVVILFFLGRPTGLLVRWNHFNDNYETTDFSEIGKGKIHTDYKVWTQQDDTNGRISIKFRGRLSYRDPKRFYNWKENTGFDVRITPLELVVPYGFTVFIETNNKVANSTGISIETDVFHNGVFEFMAIVKKNDNHPITDPILFSLKVLVETSSIGLKQFHYSKTVDYSFHLGPDLGDVWVGVDPGTTGSCIATATTTQDITIEKTAAGSDYIAPSVICIKTKTLTSGTEDDIRSNTVFGDKANAIQESDEHKKFVSIKKLLGYNDRFSLTDNISVTSSFLSTLIIEGVFKKHKSHIERKEFANDFDRFKTNGAFSPKRCVFAIPNNFTATKIQHLKECVKNVKGVDFVDIRFIYEAEAILVNYINNLSEGAPKLLLQESSNGEYVFIFDMGGATINATLANVKKRRERNQEIFEIEIIAKLGYGIGGDTIDYAFLKWLYSKEDSFEQLKKDNPFRSNNKISMQQRRKLKDAILTLKKETIKRYNDNELSTLLDRTDIRSFNGLNLDLISEENDPFVADIEKNSSNFLKGEFFEKYIWSNISSIVGDVVTICKRKGISAIDTLIMSGRSSHFPMVKDTVEGAIKPKFKSVDVILLGLEESKSAVAKGACYYGVQNSNFRLKNRTVNGAFGIIQTKSPNSTQKFLRIINDGDVFVDGMVVGTCNITSNNAFPWDGHKVRFCQVMGVDPSNIIENKEKHKYTELAVIKAQPLEVRSVHISVSEKDKVTCSITDANGDPQMPAIASANDSDIISCNDEQYTFFVKQS